MALSRLKPVDVEETTPEDGKAGQTKVVVISKPRFGYALIAIRGTAPYVQHKFSQKARAMIEARQRQGSRARTRKERAARDFEEDFHNAMHRTKAGKPGIPASAFRKALISACRLVSFTMTRAKLGLFIYPVAEFDEDGTPLVLISGEMFDPVAEPVRNETGVVDLRVRPKWKPGWRAVVPVRWDLDMFGPEDVLNLMSRAGEQVSIGEGRPDSPKSDGMGWGTFEVVQALDDVESK